MKVSDETSTETTEPDDQVDRNCPPADQVDTKYPPDDQVVQDGPAEDVFPREVVEELRRENAKYRQRAKDADTLAQRLHTELVRATGRLADPTDLPFRPDHLDNPEALAAAVEDLLARKPHLASRRPSGDIGQGNRGPSSAGFSLLQALKERT